MSLALNFIETRTWAILDEYLELMGSIAERNLDHRDTVMEAIEKRWGSPIPGTMEATVRDGVAIIPIAGPMFRYANLFTAISGATSYERLAIDIGAAMDDPAVERVVFEVNSPGGEVDGASELAELIASYRGVKPMTSFVSHLGTSAAYWVASAADEIVVANTAMLGSIGAVLGVVDRSAQDQKRGIKRMEFVSSVSPDKRVDPFSDDAGEAERGRTKLQGLVDRLGAVFVEMVASYRGVDEGEITRHRGGILVGQDAVNAGLADGVGTLEGLIERFSGRASGPSAETMSLAADGLDFQTGVGDMKEVQEVGATEAPVIDRDFLDANHPELVQAIRTEGADAERGRILKIHAISAPGFEELKSELMADPQATSGHAAERILTAQSEQESRRAKAAQDALDADEGDVEELSAATLPSSQEGDSEDQLAASILGHMRYVQAEG